MEHAEWKPVRNGASVAQIFRLQLPNYKFGMYLKVVHRDKYSSLLPEYERLIWLKGVFPVPEVLFFGVEFNYEYLLTSEVPGFHLTDQIPLDHLPKLIKKLAQSVRRIHNIPVEKCPFNKSLDVRLKEVKQNIMNGLVDTDDFDGKRKGRSAESLYLELLETRPLHNDLVFTHGDCCLPNILFNQSGELSGYIDWGNAGIADRYQDLAITYRSLTYNIGDYWAECFLNEYGVTQSNREKIEYYQLLDEFF